MRCLLSLLTLPAALFGLTLCLTLWPSNSRADQFPSFEPAAGKLQAAIVTVRISEGQQAEGTPETGQDGAEPAAPRVTICSGVSLGKGLVVSPIYAAADCRIRITLAGGQQARARVRVVDEYSGLTLLEADSRSLAGLELAEQVPAVGAWVLSAAGWGAEPPVVSLGIVSGVDRSLPGATYPPLLQCDLRAAQTSGGAGIVNGQGELVGVIVAAEPAQQGLGWAYAVPVRHVQRLLRTRAAMPQDQSLVVLKRRRPTVGMVLGGQADQVTVRQVRAKSPAEKAGIQVGDQILAADGIMIRSVYQALRPILSKQPGDTITLLVQKPDGMRTVEVVLGGGVELPAASLEQLGQYIRPKLDIGGLGPGRYFARSGRGTVREVFAPQPAPQEQDPDAQAGPDREKLKLLEKALESYRQAILYQQQQIRSLQTELDQIKKSRE